MQTNPAVEQKKNIKCSESPVQRVRSYCSLLLSCRFTNLYTYTEYRNNNLRRWTWQ